MTPYTISDLLPESIFFTGHVYHYTSAVGLYGTVKEHALWATEAFGLNDVAEIRHGFQFIHSWLLTQDQGLEVVRDLIKWIPENDDPALARGVFMCCASTVPDDASQWRLYADGARGYTVELDSAEPLGVLGRPDGLKPPVSERRTFGTLVRDSVFVSPWLRVLYGEDEKTDALDAFLAAAIDEFEYIERESSKSRDQEPEYIEHLYEVFVENLQSGLLTLAQCMKSVAFSGESEVRIVATLSAENTHCHFRPTAFGIVRYVNLVAGPPESRGLRSVLTRTESPDRLPIVGVGLGPAQVAQNSTAAAKSLLARYGYPEAVTPSSASLR